MFTADGQEDTDIKRRIGIAMTRCGQLRFILGSNTISTKTKMQIYRSAVGSLFTYGSEAWNLDQRTCDKINGVNARCLSRITGKSCHEEASARTRTYDLVKSIRQRRHKWLGHILRMQGDRLVKLAVRVQFENGSAGNIFMNTPPHATYDQIVHVEQDRKTWYL